MDESSEVFQLMARCLSGESSDDDRATLQELFTSDPNIQMDYDLLRILLPDRTTWPEFDSTKSQFNHIFNRLKKDGLM